MTRIKLPPKLSSMTWTFLTQIARDRIAKERNAPLANISTRQQSKLQNKLQDIKQKIRRRQIIRQISAVCALHLNRIYV